MVGGAVVAVVDVVVVVVVVDVVVVVVVSTQCPVLSQRPPVQVVAAVAN